MDKRKKKTILVRTPYIKYEETLELTPKLNCKNIETDGIQESNQFKIPSHYIIQKLTKGLINIERLDQAPKSLHSSYKNKIFLNEDSSKIIIRPKLNKHYLSSEKNKEIIFRRTSNETIGKNSWLTSSFNRIEQTERARRFFLQPFSNTPDLKPKKNLYGLKKKIRANTKRLFNLLN